MLIFNSSSETLELFPEFTDMTGAFGLTTLATSIAPGERMAFTLSFAPAHEVRPAAVSPWVLPASGLGAHRKRVPHDQATSVEEVTVRCTAGDLFVSLKGRGVSPSLKLVLPDACPLPCAPGTLHMGAVVAGFETTTTFILANESSYPISFQLPTRREGRTNRTSALPAIDISPREGTIAAGESRECVVTFAPDHESTDFWQVVELMVPSSRERTALCIRGHGWASSAWVLPEEVLASSRASVEEVRVPGALARSPPTAPGDCAYAARYLLPNKPRRHPWMLPTTTLCPTGTALRTGRRHRVWL